MSELRLTGDTDKTLGQFLPAPYVEKIVLYGNPVQSDTNNRFVVRTNFMVPNDSETTIYNSGVDSIKSAYKDQLEDLHYYIMYFYVNSDKASNLGDDDPDGVYNQRLPIKYYDQIINGDINPFRAYYLHAADLSRENPLGVYHLGITEFEPLSSVDPIIAFDEAGNEFLNYAHDESIYLPYYDNWADAAELRFIIFTSTETYEDVEANGDIEDPRMLNIITGDISYETIYQNSELGDPERTRFVDTNDEIYQEVPLFDLGSVPRKLTTVTQEDIVNNFQQLLDQYSTQYNSDTGFVIMKKMMDNISVILNTMADSPGILVALQQLVPTFPDKTPSKPIGKFYKSFRKRLFNFNNSIKTGEILRRKVVYDSKIVDLRISDDMASLSVNHLNGFLIDGINTYSSELQLLSENLEDAFSSDMSSEFYEEFIYTSHLIKDYKDNEELTSNRDPEEFITINYGNFFFDYEKALNKTSDISRVFDLRKLESFGISVPFRSFATMLSFVERDSLSDGRVRGEGYAKIMCTFQDAGYPASLNAYTEQFGTYEDRSYLYMSPYDILVNSPDAGWAFADHIEGLDFNTLTGEQPYAPDVDLEARYSRRDDLNSGFGSSLVVRAFSDPSNVENGYGIGQSPIDNYRLMMFQLLDYVSNREESEFGTYSANVYVLDKTWRLLQELIDQYKNALSSISKYFEYTQELCAFNNNTQTFNNFFIEEITDIYGNNPDNYPWLSAVVVFYIHQDLASDNFSGNLDLIKRTAASTSLQISPSTGTLENLESFVNLMQDFYDNFYSEHDGMYVDRVNHYYEDLIFLTGDTSGTYEITEALDLEGEGSTGAPRPGGGDVGTAIDDPDPDDEPGRITYGPGNELEIDDGDPVVGEGGLIVGSGGPGTYI
jgi:hypothetical protein